MDTENIELNSINDNDDDNIRDRWRRDTGKEFVPGRSLQIYNHGDRPRTEV